MLLFGGKMKIKLLFRYILLYMPFIIGILLLSLGVVNFLSFLLLIVGGYIAIKNTFDYRLVKRHIRKIKLDNVNINKDNLVNKDDMVKKIEPMIVDENYNKIKTRVRKK